MAPWIVHGISLVVITAVAAGCGTSAVARFYTLSSTATPAGEPAAHSAIFVGPVSVPTAVDRPQLVIQVAPNRVEIDEFHRWAAPLDDIIARVVAADLATVLGTPEVAAAPLANFRPTCRVTIDVQRFESVPGQAVLIEALWTVQDTAGKEPRSGRTLAREAVDGQDFDALAAAHSRALATLSGDIAAAIRDRTP